ncbi:MAG: 3-isopropylmalate dehydratase [Pseudomonadota bacterium]|nr:3-isopropylmalate dehydratase [Pseudomonadota bacterium]
MVVMLGSVWEFGDDINTDILAPGIYIKRPINILARHCMETVDKNFSKNVKVGDYILAGKNFGIGSSREQAAQVLKELGISAVIAKSFGGIFYRNSFNLGLPAVLIRNEILVKQGDRIHLNTETGCIYNETRKTEMFVEMIPDNLLALVKAGGLVAQLEASLR